MNRRSCSIQRITNMSQGLCMFDADGRILLFNQRYVELMDRTGMPLQGRLLIDVLREVKAVGEWDGDPDEFFACGGGGREGRQDRDQDDGPQRTFAPRGRSAHEGRRLGRHLRRHHRMAGRPGTDFPHGAP